MLPMGGVASTSKTARDKALELDGPGDFAGSAPKPMGLKRLQTKSSSSLERTSFQSTRRADQGESNMPSKRTVVNGVGEIGNGGAGKPGPIDERGITKISREPFIKGLHMEKMISITEIQT